MPHALQASTAEAANGDAKHQQHRKQPQQHSAMVQLAAPGLARLTADSDGLVVHHCLANRRDLHAEYPPGVAPAAGDAAPSSQGDALGSRHGLQHGQSTAAAAGDRGADVCGKPQPAMRAAAGSGSLGGQMTAEASEAAADDSSCLGRLRFPWECGPLLEALLHAPAALSGSLGPATQLAMCVETLPAPELGCCVTTEDVISALMREGVLVPA